MGKRFAKIVTYVPSSHAEKIRKILNLFSGGKLGKYDYCSFSVPGIGRFRPLKGATPFIGKPGKREKVKEERIETIVLRKDMNKLVREIKKAHPYEEPAIDVYPLIFP